MNRCQGSLTSEQLLAIAQAKCAACRHWERTGETIHHDCWRDIYYKASLGLQPAMDLVKALRR